MSNAIKEQVSNVTTRRLIHELASTTGAGAGTTRHWPSAAGFLAISHDLATKHLLELTVGANISVTIEATLDNSTTNPAQLSADAWVDVTSSCLSLATKTFAAAYTNGTYLLDLSHLGGRWRIVEVCAAAPNSNSRYTDWMGQGVPGMGAPVSLGASTANLGNVRVTDLTNFMPTMDAAARAGFVKVTDGTNTQPTMDAAARKGFVAMTDGTNTAAVKAASTAPAATDPAAVVSVHPLGNQVRVVNAAGEATLDCVTLAGSATGVLTKSDATTYSPPLRKIWATGAGDLTLMLSGDASNVVTIPVAANEKINDMSIKKVMAATTATGISGCQ